LIHVMRMYRHTVEDGKVEVATLWKYKEILAMTTWVRIVLVPWVPVDQNVRMLDSLKRVGESSTAWLDGR
jgi:hypothetical protein